MGGVCSAHGDIRNVYKISVWKRRKRSRDSSVVYRQDTGWMIGGSSPGRGAGNFSLQHRVQTGSGTHSASYPMGTRGSILWVKGPGPGWNHQMTYIICKLLKNNDIFSVIPI
jgi:hypothetical protein